MRPRSAASPNIDVESTHIQFRTCVHVEELEGMLGSCRGLMTSLYQQSNNNAFVLRGLRNTTKVSALLFMYRRKHAFSNVISIQARLRTVDCGSTLLLVPLSVMRRMCHGSRRAVRETTCNVCEGAGSASQAFSVQGQAKDGHFVIACRAPAVRACFKNNLCRPHLARPLEPSHTLG